MHTPRRLLAALALLSPVLCHAAGDAGSCRYVPIAKLDIDVAPHRLPTLTGSINGKPAAMLIDTGAYESRLLRQGAERLGLTVEGTGRYSYGVGGAAITYRTYVDDFAIANSHTGRTVVPVIDITTFKPNFDAIVGADTLLQTDMEVSMAGKFVQFFRASGCGDTFLAYWDRDAMEIPFIGREGGSNKPFVAVELNGVKLKAILDTGASTTVVMRHAAERAGVRLDAPGLHKAGKINGVGQAVDTWVIDFQRFRIGDETVNNPRLLVSAEASSGEQKADILLGDDFLRAHRILFAMSQDRLYMSYLGGELFGAKEQKQEEQRAAPKAP